jgi:hypothetical protein
MSGYGIGGIRPQPRGKVSDCLAKVGDLGFQLGDASIALAASWAVQTIHGVNLQGSRPRSCASFRESGERLRCHQGACDAIKIAKAG